MKKIKIFVYVSLTLNLILGFILFNALNKKKISNLNKYSKPLVNIDLSNKYNFQKIFIEKDDSVFYSVFNKSFEDDPVRAYLLACSYYMLKNDTSYKKDILMISGEVKDIFGESPNIVFSKTAH
ncbi:MAG TPA: hypothetical protein VN704_12930 [Verrucomicrobiae bacterium]|nr:hypothetical protein [Verrucomicrobiae bacterium]